MPDYETFELGILYPCPFDLSCLALLSSQLVEGSVDLGQLGPILQSFFWKALEEDQETLGEGRVAERWR